MLHGSLMCALHHVPIELEVQTPNQGSSQSDIYKIRRIDPSLFCMLPG